ncbi:MAG TPA: RagB/SusD family nutrient uptake outer membrane protein [Cyclobacteriaceae bacterium]|nr:RagB/SusD family nutrient uptake outer membrane protein [Cyclobacteriaceae bacterium]
MKAFYTYLASITLILLVVSCGDYLDVTPDNVGTLDYAFRNRNEAENYLFSCYAYLQRSSDAVVNPGFTTSSEIIYPNNLTQHPINETGFNLIRGTQNTGSPGLNSWDGENGNYSLYRSIRICNIMLENIDKPIDLTPEEKTRWIAETKFLKAYYHYSLMRMYGPVPIIDKNLPISSSKDEVRVSRAPLDSVVNYVVRLLDEAAVDLPLTISNPTKELGRITRLIALSVKAEVLVTAASPLFNGNPDYAGYKDGNGVELFSSAYDAGKWQRAADACKIAIDECLNQGLKLYTFVPPANISSLSDELTNVLTLQNAVTEKWEVNPELIWALNPVFDYQGYGTPRMTSKSVVNIFSNPSTFAVPLSTAELFYTDHGVPINEDNTWDYSKRYAIQTGTDDSRYYVKTGYQTARVNFNREPRFYASVAFDGGIWFGNGIYDQNNPFYVQARGNTSLAGPKDRNTINITGYWPKKLVHYQSVYDDGFQPVHFHLPKMRLSGLYLLYAEALNEASGPTADVYSYVNQVRQRAGIPTVEAAWTTYSRNPSKISTKEGMREIIHHERRIELCFEAQSGWDLRRWKELQEVLSKPLQGWDIFETEPENYYRPQTVITPLFGLRDYLWPIKQYDLVVNPNLSQNPYW